MDIEFYIIADKIKDYEALENFREYEKAIIHICNIEKEIAEFLGVEENIVRNTCREAYERIIKNFLKL